MATLNTRRIIRGKGTDRQGSTNSRSLRNTNIFPLGTRIPSMGPGEVEDWSPVTNSNVCFPLSLSAVIVLTRDRQDQDKDMLKYPYPPPRTLAYAI